jgi:hypothetical protein
MKKVFTRNIKKAGYKKGIDLSHFDWLLLVFLSLVIAILVFVIAK